MLKVSYSAHDARGGPVILGILRLIVFGIDTAFWIPAVMLASLADRDARLAYRMAQHWAAFNLKLTGTHVVVDGLEQLDPRQSYVFMSNHRSNLDVLVLVEALWKFQLRWVAKEELFRIPGFGWGLRATKQILVNRADHAQAVASLAAAKQRMHDRISVVFFPEGTRGCGGEMLPFKKGGFVFAIETGATIVPIAIIGTASILPRASWIPRRGGDVRVSICRPIPARQYVIEQRDALLANARAAIAARLVVIDAPASVAASDAPVSVPVGMRSSAGR